MSRNGSGTYTLPSGNPVVSGTTIEATWANTTLSDIASALTDSLSRSGSGGMTAALRIADGTQGSPGLGFANETGSGFYRAGTAEVWAVIQGAQVLNLDATGVYVPADKTTTIDGAFVFNEAGADKDARFEGNTDANLLFVDASTDRVGIGTDTPSAVLHVSRNQTAATYIMADNNGTVDASTSAGFACAEGGYVTAFFRALRDGSGQVQLYNVSNAPLLFGTNDTERARIDSSGKLGIGTTSPVFKLVISNGGAEGLELDPTAVASGALVQAYNRSGAAYTQLTYDSLLHVFRTSGTERARIDSSGNLGIGTTSTSGLRLAVDSGSTAIAANFNSTNASGVYIRLQNSSTSIGDLGAGASVVSGGTASDFGITSRSGNLVLGTGSTERARITSGGAWQAGPAITLGVYSNHALIQREANEYTTAFVSPRTTAAQNFGIEVIYSAADPNGTGNDFLNCEGNGTLRAEIRSNGGLANYSANNVNLSDRREKTNFAPAKSYLDTICAIPVQTFNYVDQNLEEDPGLTLGVVAQDVQAVAPELVMESNWGSKDNPKMRLSIYQTDLQYALMKCIQEQQALITALTARVAALEAQS